MIADWLIAALPLLVATAVLLLPGLGLLAAIRLRGLALFGLAPVASTAMIAVVALIFGAVGIAFTPLAVALAAVVMIGVAWGIGRICTVTVPRIPWRRSSTWLAIALVVGGAFSMWRIGAYVLHPEAISQTNDAIFHLNALRYITETHDASSLHTSAFIGGTGFYPSAWHAVVALVMFVTGADIPLSVNVVTLAISGIVWPLGIAWLARTMFRSTGVAIVAALLAGAMQQFPMLMFQWGVLYPNALSTSLIPAALALVVSLPTWVKGERGWRSGWCSWLLAALLVVIAFAAIAFAQPAGLLPWGVLVCCWITMTVLYASGTPMFRRVLFIALPWAALGALWSVLARMTSGSHWGHFRGKLEVWADIILNGQVSLYPMFFVSLFMLVGLVFAVRKREYHWVVLCWLAISAMYVLIAVVGNPFVRNVIFGPWYADPYRIAALAPIVVIPLAAFGLVTTVRVLVNRLSWSRGRVVAVAGVIAIVAMVVITGWRPSLTVSPWSERYETFSRYLQNDSSYLSTDEQELLAQLSDVVPEGERVIGNPGTGTGFGYVVSGLDVFPRTWQTPGGADWELIREHLRDAGTNPAVCDALETFGSPEYVLDFGLGSYGGGRMEGPGMTDFEGQPGFEEIDEVGDASLWRITACAS